MKTSLREILSNEDNLVFQVPELIKIARIIYEDLPVGHPGRKAIRKLIERLRIDLTNLDVVCQDLEWSITQKKINKIYNRKNIKEE